MAFLILEKEADGSVVKEYESYDSLLDARKAFGQMRHGSVGKGVVDKHNYLELAASGVTKMVYPEAKKTKSSKSSKKKKENEGEAPPKKKAKGSEGPKRMSGYIYYSNSKRPQVKERLLKEQPELSSKDFNQEVMKILAADWKKLSPSEQQHYKDIAPIQQPKDKTTSTTTTKKRRDTIVDKVALQNKMEADGFKTIETENEGKVSKTYESQTGKIYTSLIEIARTLYPDHVKTGVLEQEIEKGGDQLGKDPIQVQEIEEN
uniref:HMG box domain-containing protein n=1 Tax=Aureoumbra lagunensis TaxID=44058 RepID=A0A7S3JY60_9STRA|mmetsp:Transcript_11002/g.16521  ORF Transcript_11002/g.16521 Transcript_11002/m.16521 type:complete len:261 (+) Transcript_11002:74-856(+)